MGFVMLEVHFGLGRHKFYFSEDRYVGFLKYDYLDWCQVFITLATCKIAICLFSLRISKFDRWRNFLYGMIAFFTLTHIPLTLLYIFQCRPVNKVWSEDIPGECWSSQTVMDIIVVQGGQLAVCPSSEDPPRIHSITWGLPFPFSVLMACSRLYSNRPHPRCLPSPPPLEHEASPPPKVGSQPPHGTWRRHSHGLHNTHRLLLRGQSRRQILGRCTQCPLSNAGNQFRNHCRLHAYDETHVE